MITFPNCKINIGLFITGKRQDGYHNLETIFHPVKSHFDVLEVLPSKAESSLNLSGLVVDVEREKNLVWKAYQLLKAEFPTKVGAFNIYLHKVIPMGAGLGGGSADAVFMLILLNSLCNLNLSSENLAEYALQLGSDCPFFIENKTCYASGRGEQMVPIDLPLDDYEISVQSFPFGISTREAFSGIQPKQAAFDLKSLATVPVSEWRYYIHNDFEAVVARQHPEISDAIEGMYNAGAAYAQMTGSGSSVYGLFRKG